MYTPVRLLLCRVLWAGAACFCSAAIVAQDQTLSPQQAWETLEVASGLQVTTFAADPDIVSISNLDVDHRGRVWACEAVNYRMNNGKRPAGDRILILEDTDGDGVSNKTTVFYQGRDIDVPMGLCVLGNKAIVSVSPNILLLEDTDGDDRADKKTVLLTGDAEFQHDHSLHSFVFGPDGRFYGNFGNTGHRLADRRGKTLVDVLGNELAGNGSPYWGGLVFRCDRDFATFEVLGHNFRNNYEATVDSFGGVWQSDNDDDGNLAVRFNYVLEGGNYGYLDEITGERWLSSRIGEHADRWKRHWHQNDPGTVPNVLETGNGAPTCMTVYEGRLLPRRFWDQVIHCDAGPGFVRAYPVNQAGAGFVASMENLLQSSDSNFRPIDVAVAPDGSLFVSDWYDPVVGGFQQEDIQRGRIYWIAPPGHQYATPNYRFDSARQAVEALRSPNYCARAMAWISLYDFGVAAEEALRKLLHDDNPRMRARALWLLGQTKGLTKDYLSVGLADKNANVRVTGLRLAHLLNSNVLDTIERLAADPSARVRAECAVMLRHHDSIRAAKVWARLAYQHDGKDRWYLEALGIGADRKWDTCLEAWLANPACDTASAAYRDIVWRSRGSTSPELLAKIISQLDDPTEAQLGKYVRAFDFQSRARSDDMLLSLALSPHTGLTDTTRRTLLGRVSPHRLTSHVDARNQLKQLLQKAAPNATTVQLIEKQRLASLYPTLLDCAETAEDDGLRVQAMRALLNLKQTDLIATSLNGPDQARATATATTLAITYHSGAVDLLLPVLSTDSPLSAEVRRTVAKRLAEYYRGAMKLLDLIAEKKLAPDTEQAVAVVMLTHWRDEVRYRAQKLLGTTTVKNGQPLPKLSALLRKAGDAVHGRQVFRNQGKCLACHRVSGEGQHVGPDLSQIGEKLGRAALLESILYPSAGISHNYESYQLQLADGLAVRGVLSHQNADAVSLAMDDGVVRTFERSKIEAMAQQPISLMPADLHTLMSAQDLVDLVAYLETLQLQRDGRIRSNGPTVRR